MAAWLLCGRGAHTRTAPPPPLSRIQTRGRMIQDLEKGALLMNSCLPSADSTSGGGGGGCCPSLADSTSLGGGGGGGCCPPSDD